MIIRRRHTRNYTTIGNVLFEDERLAADEVGILAFLLSRPHDWEVRRPALMRRWGIGITAMKRIVNNWMRTGWCHAEKTRLPNGQFFIIYEIRDEPGKELSDDEIREALSLVSSEGSDGLSSEATGRENQPHVASDPPPCHPLLAGQSVADGGVAYKDNTNNGLPRDDSDQKNEREYARAKEKHAVGLQQFKRRYPTTASDDQGRIDRAWFALSFEEGDAALAGIPAFLEKLKHDKRTTIPAAYTYLEQKRWTLLDKPKGVIASHQQFELSSREGRAIAMLYEIVGKTDFFFRIVCRERIVYSKIEMTQQMLALADIPSRQHWTHQAAFNEAGAWKRFAAARLGELSFRMVEGASLPKPFPPLVDGTWSKAEGPTDDDLAVLANEGQR